MSSKILLPNGNSCTSHPAQHALNQMVSLNNGSNSEKHHEKSKTIKNELSNGFSMPKSNPTGQSLAVTIRDPIQKKNKKKDSNIPKDNQIQEKRTSKA